MKSLDKDGFLYKKQNATGNWSKYFFNFVPEELELRYYKTKEDFFKNKVHGNILISYMSLHQTRREDKLAHEQLKASKTSGTIHVSTYRLKIVSPKRAYILSAETDEELLDWVNKLKVIYYHLFSEEEISEKKTAWKKFEPYYREQLKQQLEQLKSIINALQEAGIFSSRPSGKVKEGYLDLWKGDNWKQYYFILFKETLTYFNLHQKQIPRGIISLPAITSLVAVNEGEVENTLEKFSGSIVPKHFSKSHSNSNSPPSSPSSKDSGVFLIHTLIRTYVLRAKHDVAMNEWVSAIQQKSSDHVSPTSKEVELDGQVVDLPGGESILIEYTANGKAKKQKMKKKLLTIGRSHKSDLILDDDKKVSRNHCKISLSPKNVPILSDLGSMSGTFLNGVKVTVASLNSGDQVTVGETTLKFFVLNSKGKVIEKKP